MHILDFSYDDLLEIVKRVRVADIRSWIQTCKAFASLQEPHLALPLRLLRLAEEHDLSPDILELPVGASVDESLVTRPQRFQNLLLQEALNGQSLICYHTTIQDEEMLEAKIVPGGRWLVTITVSVEDSSDHPMMCRVWDLDHAQEESDLEPYASMSLPNSGYDYPPQIWLRRSTGGNTAQIWVHAHCRGLMVIEFDHLDRKRPLKLLRVIAIKGMDTSEEGIGLHGDYVFNVTGPTITVLNWVTGLKKTFEFEPPIRVISNLHVLSIGPEGLVMLHEFDQTIAFYVLPGSGLGARDWSEPVQGGTENVGVLYRVKWTTIQGINIVPYGPGEPLHWPPVNGPYSAHQPATSVIRFPQHLVYVEYPSNPRETDLDKLPLAFAMPPGSYGPHVYRRTVGGHVVGVGGMGFDVHFLMKDGTQSVQSFEHEFGVNFTPRFVCPFGGVIGAFGTSEGADRMDKIYLWKLDGSS